MCSSYGFFRLEGEADTRASVIWWRALVTLQASRNTCFTDRSASLAVYRAIIGAAGRI